jgi:hypothetical protein
MSDVVTYGIEAAVGAVCLAAGYSVRQRPGLRMLGVLFAVAGIAAVVHAAVSLM